MTTMAAGRCKKHEHLEVCTSFSSDVIVFVRTSKSPRRRTLFEEHVVPGELVTEARSGVGCSLQKPVPYKHFINSFNMWSQKCLYTHIGRLERDKQKSKIAYRCWALLGTSCSTALLSGTFSVSYKALRSVIRVLGGKRLWHN